MTDIAMIRAAAERGEGALRETPLLNAPLLDKLAGRRIWVKAETLQWTGSFKFRGGWSAVSALVQSARNRTASTPDYKGVIAYSSGNHAQGVALAAQRHGWPAVVVMPADAPEVKIANTRAYGAEVVLYDRDTEDRDAIGNEIAARRGLALIRPYDDAQVIAGQGTCGLEIARQAKASGIDRATVLTCCGGGGLSSGIALALEVEAPHLAVCPVEPEGFDDVARSLASGQRERNASASGSVCDAIVTPSPGEITFPILRRLCKRGYVVSDDEALRAMVLAFQHLRIVVEPGGAVALAAALFNATDAGDNIICVASGGNVDPVLFGEALRRFG